MTYVFEDGDFGRGELITYAWERFRYVPIFAPKKDTTDKIGNVRPGFTPLQAADFLAHTMIRACGRGSYPIRRPDWVMDEFYKMNFESPSIFDAPALSNYATEIKVWEATYQRALDEPLKLGD